MTDPIPAPITKAAVAVELQPVAEDLVAPIYLTHAGDGTGRLFVVDQAGQVRLIKNDVLQAAPYLDVASLLVSLGGIIPDGNGNFQQPFTDFDERGLLGLAFHPDFATTGAAGFGKLYTYTSEPVAGPADFTVALPPGASFNHQSVVREWTVDPTADITGADPATDSRVLLRVDEPQFNHNAGMIDFGNDGNLYIAFGDGGRGNDVGDGHGTTGNGRDKTNVLGSILRIDVNGADSANGQYGIPADNPFVSVATDPAGNIPDEIFATGLRNPFRFSFDRPTGRLIVGDVGQNNIEEVNLVTAGGDFGWNFKEGTFAFDPTSGNVSADTSGLPAGLIDPVLQYDHDEGISVIGGFVYHGSAIPSLAGQYVFGDFSTGFFTPDGRLFFADLDTGDLHELILGADDRMLGLFVKGFGQGPDGELYLLAGENLGPFRDEIGRGFGKVFRIVPVPEPTSVAVAVMLGAVLVRRRCREAGRTMHAAIDAGLPVGISLETKTFHSRRKNS